MMTPLATPTLSEPITLIDSVPLTVAPDAGLTIEVVGALVSVPPVVAGVGRGGGAVAGDVVPPEVVPTVTFSLLDALPISAASCALDSSLWLPGLLLAVFQL